MHPIDHSLGRTSAKAQGKGLKAAAWGAEYRMIAKQPVLLSGGSTLGAAVERIRKGQVHPSLTNRSKIQLGGANLRIRYTATVSTSSSSFQTPRSLSSPMLLMVSSLGTVTIPRNLRSVSKMSQLASVSVGAV